MKKTKVYRARRGIRFDRSPQVGMVSGRILGADDEPLAISGSVSSVIIAQGRDTLRNLLPGTGVVLTSSLVLADSVSYGKLYERNKLDKRLLGLPSGGRRSSPAIVDAGTGSIEPPSWTHASIGRNDSFVITPFSASDHPSQVLNYFRSGSEAVEETVVPVSTTLYYSKQQRYQTIIVKHTASFFDTVVRATGTVPISFAAGTGTLCATVTGTNMPALVNSANNPATIYINVPVSGRLVDIKVWVELIHLSRSSGQHHPLAITGLALKSPNVRWGHAHPIYNDKIFRKQALDDHFSASVPNFYGDTFLLWEGPGLSPTGGDQRQITNGAAFPFATNAFNTQKYPCFDRDRSMRTIFSDGAATPNPRHLYSPTSPSGNFLGAPNSYHGMNSAYGNNVPWTSDATGLSSTDPVTYSSAGSPPVGWLTGPGKTNSVNEWPTTGVNYGADSLRPIYPLLDPIYVRKIIGTETTFMSSSVYPIAGSPELWRGFRPGLRGSEISGTWELLLVNNFHAGTFAQTDTADMYFRQVRLEITYENNRAPGAVRVSTKAPARRANEPLYLFSISGTDKSNIGTLSGSGPDYFKSEIYTTTPSDSAVGRTFGIVLNSGSVGNDYALLYKLTGSLADISGSAPGWLLNNMFGVPMIPDSSSSLSSYVPPPPESVPPIQEVMLPSKTLDGARRLQDVAADFNPQRTLAELVSSFVSSSLT